MSNTNTSGKETIYIAPGYNSCNVYSMPYPMRPGQSPRDLNERYQSEWVRIGQLDHNLNVRFLDKRYQHLKDDIQGQGPLTHFTIDAVDINTHIQDPSNLIPQLHDQSQDSLIAGDLDTPSPRG